MGITDTIKGKLPENKSGSRKGFSVRQSFPGVNQAAGIVGKGRPAVGTSAEAAKDHSSAPLSTLKDPASFGPPPRHIARADVKPVAGKASSTKSYETTGLVANPNSLALKTAPAATGGWGAPLPEETVKVVQTFKEHPDGDLEEEKKPKGPPMPYRANTTGINPNTLPKPPLRAQPIQMEDNDQPQTSKPRPLPPRLPARQNSQPSEHAPTPAPTYTVATKSAQQPSYLNQGALGRLGQAGVSVPGFGIGRTATPQSESSHSPSPQQPGQSSSQLSELEQRFSKLPGHVSSPASDTPSPAAGTTWAQKQAALKTASQFQKDPSSVSLSDAKEAGITMNNFRQRHGEQIASGLQGAQGLDKKYGVSGRVGGWGQSEGQSHAPLPALEAGEPPTSPRPSVVGKKPPPPPPPKKKNLVGEALLSDVPPPIPLASRPKPGF